MTAPDPIADWPARTREVYVGLQAYRIVGASACLAAIVDGLRVLAESGASPQQLAEAGAAFCALKPDCSILREWVGSHHGAGRWARHPIEGAGACAATVGRSLCRGVCWGRCARC